jgi:hypothetical protein
MPYIAWNALNILNTSHKTKDETGARLRRSMASFERKPHTSKCSNLTLSILGSTSFPGARLESPGLCRSILHSDWLTPYLLSKNSRTWQLIITIYNISINLWLLCTSIFCKIIFQSKKFSIFPTAWITFASAGYKTQKPFDVSCDASWQNKKRRSTIEL